MKQTGEIDERIIIIMSFSESVGVPAVSQRQLPTHTLRTQLDSLVSNYQNTPSTIKKRVTMERKSIETAVVENTLIPSTKEGGATTTTTITTYTVAGRRHYNTQLYSFYTIHA